MSECVLAHGWMQADTGWQTCCNLSCRSFFAKEPLTIRLFCGKWPATYEASYASSPLCMPHPLTCDTSLLTCDTSLLMCASSTATGAKRYAAFYAGCTDTVGDVIQPSVDVDSKNAFLKASRRIRKIRMMYFQRCRNCGAQIRSNVSVLGCRGTMQRIPPPLYL